MRYTYRITKYDPIYRKPDGSYGRDEWTSFAQVGTTISGRKVTMAEYEAMERKYLCVIQAAMREIPEVSWEIRDVKKKAVFQEASTRQALGFARRVLREQVWGKLMAPRRGYVHFGWDYYLYVGFSRKPQKLLEKAEMLGLYVEECPSPYLAR